MKITDRSWIFGLGMTMLLLFLVLWGIGCAGGADSGDSGSDQGELIIGLTDAEGDFISYAVDVTSLTLTRKNGAVVETLPLETRIDFAQYTDMTEFLTVATIPPGSYTQATLHLDYQNADIWVEDANGDGVKVTGIVDEDGQAVTRMDLSVSLEGRNEINIIPGVPANLTLDFDLEASNLVENDVAGEPMITVSPVLVADVNLEQSKTHRLRGPLQQVDLDGQSFDVVIRPFLHKLISDQRRFGTLTAHVSEETVYVIDGETYTGQSGLEALAALDQYTGVVVFGEIGFKPFCFTALEVNAGSNVPGSTMDAVTGNVISREENTLTVKGASLMRTDCSIIFNDIVTVTISEDTGVTRQYADETFTIDDISVGQRVTVFGTLTDADVYAPELDATEGFVLMKFTDLRGTVVDTVMPSTGDTGLVVNLNAINRRNINIFDFSGTGGEESDDADPSVYEIDVQSLDMTFLGMNAPVMVRGFVNSFGSAPPDFTAYSIMNTARVKAFLKIQWKPSSVNAITDVSAAGIVIDAGEANKFHHIGRGRVLTDVTQFDENPVIQPVDGGDGLFFIIQKHAVQFFPDYAGFADDLTDRLASGLSVKQVYATGYFDDATATLTANRIKVMLE